VSAHELEREERMPSRDELAAMAYVDGEMPQRERVAFEARLEKEPSLVREVAGQQRLAVMARAAAPREPIDEEWRRIEGSAVHRMGLPIGWTLRAVGGIGLSVWCAWAIAMSSIGIVPKLLTAALAAGFLFLFLLAVRARIASRPFDPYDGVKR
jgi:anti-sigma-K factor RskA